MTNLRAIGFMIVAVAAFAVTDAFVKAATTTVPIGQCMLLISFANFLWFFSRLKLKREAFLSREALNRAVIIRSLGEVVGSFAIFAGLALLPLSTVSAIMQSQPLVVMMVAAVLLGETVGWRRWLAAGVGFIGVLVILRPEGGSFDPAMTWPLVGVLGLTARDVGTRLLPPRISADFAITWAVALLTLLGAILTALQDSWAEISAAAWGQIAGATVAVTIAFVFITRAFREGEIAAVAPFRYTRMVFALFIAIVVFEEQIDTATWTGIVLIIGSGLYALWREHRASKEIC